MNTDYLLYIYLGFAVIFTVLELFTHQLIFLFFAVGAITGSIFFHLFYISFFIFIITSVALLIFVRPIIRRFLVKHNNYHNTIQDIVDAEVIVIEKVDKNGGLVKYKGELWKAKTMSNSSIASNQKAKILELTEGILIIKEEKKK